MPNTVSNQLKHWYDIDIEEGTIEEELRLALEASQSANRMLLIRDWSFGSFVPIKYNSHKPTGTLNTIDHLQERVSSGLKVFAIVRNPIDVWLSMYDSEKTFHDDKLEYYNDFVDDVLERKIPIFKYETFCEQTTQTLKKIYEVMGKKVNDNPKLSHNVVGDINFPESSRAARKDSVQILGRRVHNELQLQYMKTQTRINCILDKLSYSERL